MKKQLYQSLLFAVCVLFGTITATTFNGTANLVLTGGETVEFPSGTISLNADRTIRLDGTASAATISIGASSVSGAVTVKPADNTDAQLLFDVYDADSVLTINVLNDLFFTSNNTGNKAMYLSFRGKGLVKFRLPSGRTISFGPEDASSTVGTKVRILMEQKKTQADEQAQVSFEKWSYAATGPNSDLTKHTYIKVGRLSSFEFVSPHASGLPSADIGVDGYGTVEFDASSQGTGRLILDLAKGTANGDFQDAAFNVFGSRVIGTGLSETDVQTVDMRTGVVNKYRAGIAATMRVTDRVVRAHYGGDSAGWTTHAASTDNQRGLVVLSHNHSYPRLANNYDQRTAVAAVEDFGSVTGLDESMWFVANTVQCGFVLGNNGILEVEHNQFVDYYACGINVPHAEFPKANVHVATDATTGADDTHHASKVKKHNPAALIVDGNAFRVTGTTAAKDANFAYDSTDYAHIILRGNAGLFTRVAASSSSGLMMNAAINADGTTAADGTYIDGTIGKGSYDGISVPVLDGSNISAHQSANLDGECALDIEGALRVVSTASSDDVHAANGYINVPTIMIDYRGKELKFSSSALSEAGSRPLSMASGTEFYRYNTSTILVNDQVELENVRLIHNDVSRDLRDLPIATGAPAIIGGELPSLKVAKTFALNPSEQFVDFTGSAVYLHNAKVECHESLVSAGVHWVVREGVMSTAVSEGDNSSDLIFYNRGNDHDLSITRKGRTFQLGSRSNVMADGTTIDPYVFSDGSKPISSLRDAFIDVYRQDKIPTGLTPVGDETNAINLKISSQQESGIEAADKALHFVHLADRSQINLGWSAGQHDNGSMVVVQADNRYAPWRYTAAVVSFVTAADPANANAYRFTPYTQGLGTLELAAHNLYISAGGRYDATGSLSPADNELPPRRISDSGGILFVDHGGQLKTSGSFDAYIDTLLARRTSKVAAAIGQITLDGDQFIEGDDFRVHTYGYDSTNDALPNIVTGQLPSISFHVPDIPTPDDFSPVKGGEELLTRGSLFDGVHRRSFGFRSTDSVTAPVTMPSSGLMVLKTGDAVEQAHVSGATRANPFHLWLTGSSLGFARVREFVSIKSDPAVFGEGAHAALFLDEGARIGLGSRHWNEHSVHAWNQLGQDKVSLFVNGDGVVDLNSDLVIIDKLPLVATENFGQGANAHRLLFYSEVPREIVVPANGELDLSSFGRSSAGKQIIAFGGQTRLILEPGAKIRFPATVTGGDAANGPVLEFDDDAKLILLGNRDRTEGRWTDGLTGSDKVRSKFLGKGTVRLLKKARMEIFEEALVGVEADVSTPVTDLTFQINDDAGLYIGDDVRSGGAFQIGNMVTGGGDGTNNETPTQVNFTLALDGENARCHIAREGFFGIAAGTVNKIRNPNGTAANSSVDPSTDPVQFTAWRLQTLRDVKNVTLEVKRGFFDHNQIYNGSQDSADGSVLAIGPIDYDATNIGAAINGGAYTLRLGPADEAFVRGGGNVVIVGPGNTHDAPHPLSVWSTVEPLTGTDTGKYNLMAPTAMIRVYDSSTHFGTFTASGSLPTGIAMEYTSRAVSTADAGEFANKQAQAYSDIYYMLTLPRYLEGLYDNESTAVPLGKARSGVVVGYRTGTSSAVDTAIIRDDTISTNFETALDKGFLRGIATNADAPGSFGAPR